MNYGSRLGFRKKPDGIQDIRTLPKAVQDTYYGQCAEILTAHQKAMYDQELMYKHCVNALETAKDKALAEASHAAFTTIVS